MYQKKQRDRNNLAYLNDRGVLLRVLLTLINSALFLFNFSYEDLKKTFKNIFICPHISIWSLRTVFLSCLLFVQQLSQRLAVLRLVFLGLQLRCFHFSDPFIETTVRVSVVLQRFTNAIQVSKPEIKLAMLTSNTSNDQPEERRETNLLSICEWMFCQRSLSWSALSLCQSRSKSRSLCALNMRSLMTRAFCSSSSMSWNTSCFSSISARHCYSQNGEWWLKGNLKKRRQRW